MSRIAVAGVALGRFQLRDGRPPDSRDEVAQMVAGFQPGVVPIVSKHGPDGVLLGYLDALAVEHGRDLRFSGAVFASPDIAERLRSGVGVSIETCEGRQPYPGETGAGASLAETNPHWRGTLRLGQNLIGVALSDRPAAKDSVIWAAPPDDLSAWTPPEAFLSRDTKTRWTDLDWSERNARAVTRTDPDWTEIDVNGELVMVRR